MELTPKAAWEAYWDEGRSFPELAVLFGVSVGTISRRFASWNFPTRPRGPRRGGAGSKSRLTDDQVRYILETIGEKSTRVLQGELGVSFQRISQIRLGQHRPIE